ncbi:DUF1499 domain-containing protein [Pararhizobium haloflavum]|uniref:DUF1499 domain-containing protein n=1 Tax=Pararhizobium haloflavum TaxID=2037914 RepID=UPI000C19C4C6|nr:DUF1499 domain-containing protein [Pararhizobium haloflavum]
MLKIIVLSLGAVVLASLAAFLLIGRERSWELLAGPADLGRYDFEAEARSATANDALACAPGLCRTADIDVAPFEDAPSAVIETIIARLREMNPHLRRVDDGDDAGYARLVIHTPLMRYPDTVDIAATRLPDGRTGVRAYSRSKIGSGDMGANRKRLRTLFEFAQRGQVSGQLSGPPA